MKRVFFALLFALPLLAVERQVINIGTQPNDGTGDSIRAAFAKVNANFATAWSLMTNNTVTNITILTNSAGFRSSPIMSQSFSGSVLPSDWVESDGGPWRVNNGLTTPASGGSWTNYIYWNQASTLDDTVLSAVIQPASSSSAIGIARVDTIMNLVGTALVLDGQNGRLALHGPWDGSTTPALGVSVALPASLITTHSYYLELGKTDAGNYTGLVIDLTTGASTNLTASAASVNVGNGWANPGVVQISGQATIKTIRFGTRSPRAPQLHIIGDSYVEGDSIRPAFDQRYAVLVSRMLNGNCTIAGRGGESSGSVLSRLPADLEYFGPAYVLCPLGANDTDFATWKANVLQLVSKIQALGGVPILGTLAPRADRQAFLDEANAWILTNGVRYVDFAFALTLNGDRRTWNPDYALGDGVHPSIAGHAVMASQVVADVPEVFTSHNRAEFADLPGVSIGPSFGLTKPLKITTAAGVIAFDLSNAAGVNRIQAHTGEYLIIDGGSPGVSIGHYGSEPVFIGLGGGQLLCGASAQTTAHAGRWNFEDGCVSIGSTNDAGAGGLVMSGLLWLKGSGSELQRMQRTGAGDNGFSWLADNTATYLRVNNSSQFRLVSNNELGELRWDVTNGWLSVGPYDPVAPLTIGAATYGGGQQVIWTGNTIPGLVVAGISDDGYGDVRGYNTAGSMIWGLSRRSIPSTGSLAIGAYGGIAMQAGLAGATNVTAPQLVLDTMGRVGIGTNAPSRPLAVVGILSSQDGTDEALMYASGGLARFGAGGITPVIIQINGNEAARFDTNYTFQPAGGYKSVDGSVGMTTTITNLVPGVATNRLSFKDGLLVASDPL